MQYPTFSPRHRPTRVQYLYTPTRLSQHQSHPHNETLLPATTRAPHHNLGACIVFRSPGHQTRCLRLGFTGEIAGHGWQDYDACGRSLCETPANPQPVAQLLHGQASLCVRHGKGLNRRQQRVTAGGLEDVP